MSESSGGTETQVPTQLTNTWCHSLILHNNDLEQYTQKVELLSSIWPATKMNELITRLILGTTWSCVSETTASTKRHDDRRSEGC